MDCINSIQGRANGPRHPTKIIGHPISNGTRQLAVGLFTQNLDHLAGIDTNRATGRAETVGSAGILPRILIGFGQRFDLLRFATAGHPPADLPSPDNALARGKSQVLGRTDRFTKTTLDTLVNKFMGRR